MNLFPSPEELGGQLSLHAGHLLKHSLILICVTFWCTTMSNRLNTKNSKILNWSSIIVTLFFFPPVILMSWSSPAHAYRTETIWVALEEFVLHQKKNTGISHIFPIWIHVMPFFSVPVWKLGEWWKLTLINITIEFPKLMSGAQHIECILSGHLTPLELFWNSERVWWPNVAKLTIFSY